MKYRLTGLLSQKERNRSAPRSAGMQPESGEARTRSGSKPGKQALQFKYCWQANDDKRQDASNRLNEVFKNPEIK